MTTMRIGILRTAYLQDWEKLKRTPHAPREEFPHAEREEYIYAIIRSETGLGNGNERTKRVHPPCNPS